MTTKIEPTISVPEAALRYFNIKSKAAAYAAAKRGDIPTIECGRRKRVPVRAMERKIDRIIEEQEQGRGVTHD